jgi:hypothetical protein
MIDADVLQGWSSSSASFWEGSLAQIPVHPLCHCLDPQP